MLNTTSSVNLTAPCSTASVATTICSSCVGSTKYCVQQFVLELRYCLPQLQSPTPDLGSIQGLQEQPQESYLHSSMFMPLMSDLVAV